MLYFLQANSLLAVLKICSFRGEEVLPVSLKKFHNLSYETRVVCFQRNPVNTHTHILPAARMTDWIQNVRMLKEARDPIV